MRLNGRVALVTGAQQGIGRAVAAALARDGADVAVNWLDDRDGADETARAVSEAGRQPLLVQADLSSVPSVRAMVEAVAERFGRLDVLVNNAGLYPRQAFLDLDEATWDAVHAVNLRGAAFCAQAAARVMVARGRGGAIVNVSSLAVRGSPNGAHYSASKAGLLGLTRAMALELAPHRIRVNAVAPGLVDTAQPRQGFSEEALHEAGRALPLGRLGRPDEVAEAVLFLASERSSFATGEVIHLNGGSYMA